MERESEFERREEAAAAREAAGIGAEPRARPGPRRGRHPARRERRPGPPRGRGGGRRRVRGLRARRGRAIDRRRELRAGRRRRRTPSASRRTIAPTSCTGRPTASRRPRTTRTRRTRTGSAARDTLCTSVGSGVAGEHGALWMPQSGVRVLPPQCPSFRPAIELVFASWDVRPMVLRRGGPRRGRRLAVVHGSAPPAGDARGGRQPPHRSGEYVEEVWRIPVDHFDPDAAPARCARPRAVPLGDVLVEGSTYHRGASEAAPASPRVVKRPVCELCGQGEMWRGRRMSLVLDHINGVHDDHRLENLRILCPNCNATLDTHCGAHKTRKHHDRPRAPPVREVLPAGDRRPALLLARRAPGAGERNRRAQAARRRVERPPYDQLVAEIAALGYTRPSAGNTASATTRSASGAGRTRRAGDRVGGRRGADVAAPPRGRRRSRRGWTPGPDVPLTCPR